MKSLYRRKRGSIIAAVIFLVSFLPSGAGAVDMSDYTAFPPFLPRVVSPNILFLLDLSSSMVRPAYGRCDEEVYNCVDTFVNIFDDYTSSKTYHGYFVSRLDNGTLVKYNGDTGGYTRGTDATPGTNAGNWLNWLAMTQFDIMMQTVVGGNFTPSPDGNATLNTLQSQLTATNALGNPIKITKIVHESHCPLGCSGPAMLPQVIPYSWVDTPTGYTELASGNNAGWVGEIDFPFEFTLYTTTFPENSKMTINVNGWAAFKAGGTSKAVNYKMPTTQLYDYAIAPLWTNQQLGLTVDSEIQYFVKGTTPNRVAVITFLNVIDEDYDESKINKADTLTYQILFFEKGSHIVFQYKEVQEGATTSSSHPTSPNTLWGGGAQATIGVQGAISAGETLEVKLRSHRGVSADGKANTLLTNGMALLMTPKHMAFDIVPRDNNDTLVIPSPPLNSASLTRPVSISIDTDTPPCDDGWFYHKTRDECFDHAPNGLLHDLRDGLLGGRLGFRLGIMELRSPDGGSVIKHFNEKDPVIKKNGEEDIIGWQSILNAIRGASPVEHAPLAEALYLAQGYFREDTGYRWTNNDWSNLGAFSCGTNTNTYDPFCFKSAGLMVDCCKSFILMVSGGNYSQDFKYNIFDDEVDNTDQAPASGGYKATDDSGSEGTRSNEGWLDNIAYKAHVTDLRTDLASMQNLGIYVVNTYGEGYGKGTEVLKKAARYGGFTDENDNNSYDSTGAYDCDGDDTKETGEDDKNCDGKPDTYFEPSSDSNLKNTIAAAVLDILKSSASGTSVSVLSTSAGGEGAVYQAYFYPARIESGAEERTWPGYMRSFFIDKYQNMRDDASGGSYTEYTDDNGETRHSFTGTGDLALVQDLVDTTNKGDYISQMFLGNDFQVRVKLIEDEDGLILPAPDMTVLLDDVASIFEAGEQLALRNKTTRMIYTWVDTSNDGVVDNGDFKTPAGEAMLFHEDNASTLAPYLRAVDTDEATDIIDFVRGENVVGYRDRCITVDGTADSEPINDRRQECSNSDQRTWALGDIVYSTPTLVSNPGEKYDQIYGDTGYREFAATYHGRRNIVYVGANDGMLHAFNAGIFHPSDKGDTTGVTEYGWFAENPSSGDGWTKDVGEELWAFVPHDVLPHLAWTACNGTAYDPSVCGESTYTHTYFVDHRPKVSDVRIFCGDDDSPSPCVSGQPDVAHPNGWGTILIAALRLGGGAIDVTAAFGNTTALETRSFRSAYYALDITNPEEKPRLLWRFTDDNLGFSTSYPAIAKVKDSDSLSANEKWFMVLGSGPANTTDLRDYNFDSTTQTGRIYVVDLINGSYTEFDTETELGSGHANSIMGDPSVVDVDLDFSADVIYIGSALSNTKGKIYRLNTRCDTCTYSSLSPSNWKLTELFTDSNMGPLLIPPSASMDNKGRFWVYFGTGRLRNQDDLLNKDQQKFYGIKDGCWFNLQADKGCNAVGTNSSYTIDKLFDSTDVFVGYSTGTATQVEDNGTNACDGETDCSYRDMVDNINQKDGWYVKLGADGTNASERVLARSAVLGGLVLFTTYKPVNDVCSIFGDSYLYGLYYESGTAYNKPVMPEDTGGEIDKKYALGKGLPTAVGVAVGETVTGFVQKSTGEIVRIETQPGLDVRSGAESWRQKTKGGGTVELEQTYKHIVK